jgi:hypothetical protein
MINMKYYFNTDLRKQRQIVQNQERHPEKLGTIDLCPKSTIMQELVTFFIIKHVVSYLKTRLQSVLKASQKFSFYQNP